MKGLGPRIRRHPRFRPRGPGGPGGGGQSRGPGGLAVEAIRVAQGVQAAEANHAAWRRWRRPVPWRPARFQARPTRLQFLRRPRRFSRLQSRQPAPALRIRPRADRLKQEDRHVRQASAHGATRYCQGQVHGPFTVLPRPHTGYEHVGAAHSWGGRGK